MNNLDLLWIIVLILLVLNLKGSPFSSELLNNMIKRRDALMENVVMLSAMYLDQRFSFELSDDQVEKAVAHICKIQTRITSKI